MNIKDILNNVLGQSGFIQKEAFFGSSDPDDIQMTAIANRAATEIRDYFRWPTLRNSYTFDMITGQIRYALPADYGDMIPDSAWETEGNRKVDLPVPQGRWFMYKFTSWSDGGTIRARLYGDEIEVHDPVTGESFEFEYVSRFAVEKRDTGDRKEYFEEDTDLWLLDDQLLILGIQAHWMQSKLMPQYVEHFANYNRKMSEAIGRSTGGQTIGGVPRPLRNDPYYPLWRPGS